MVTYLAASNVAFFLMTLAQKIIQGSTLKHDHSWLIGNLETLLISRHIFCFAKHKHLGCCFLYILLVVT